MNGKVNSVLIVEDNAEDCELYRRQMLQNREQDYVFSVTESGEEGIQMYCSTQPDCVLLDYNLPDIDGLEFLSRLGRERDLPCLPVVMMTGQGNEAVAVEAMKRGAQDYLIKGTLTPQLLRLAVQNAVEKVALHRRIKELDKVKSDFLSTASHELRTPLTIIREFVALVLDRITGPVTDEQAECLHAALQSCDRLGTLINNILDLQRIESGGQRLHRHKTDLGSLLRDCVRDFLPTCQKKNQQVKVNIPQDLPFALCDPESITQVMVNLIGNAHKFTPLDGQITLRASLNETDPSCLAISVEDTGLGIREEDQELIFEKFTQIERQQAPGPHGTGLGLAIARKIVVLNGGTIAVQSTVGIGSTFSLTLPVYAERLEPVAFIEDARAAAIASGNDLFVALLRVDAKTASGAPSRLDSDLAALHESIRRSLRRREDDALVIPSEAAVLVSMEINRALASSVRERLARTAITDCGHLGGMSIAGGVLDPDDLATDWLELIRNQYEPLRREPERKRVLVIDDDEIMVNLVAQALESNLSVTVARSQDGYDGCLLFGRFEPDLVVLDIIMPGCDGKQVLQQIKSDAQRQGTKVVAISGSPDIFPKLSELGADECLAKPFAIKDLIAVATRLLGHEAESSSDKRSEASTV